VRVQTRFLQRKGEKKANNFSTDGNFAEDIC